MQDTGAKAAQALATGTATDISAATVAVEKAAIALQLTAAFRNKAVEAYQDVMRMQI
jgi:flagellar hook-basal body complex protein FliE